MRSSQLSKSSLILGQMTEAFLLENVIDVPPTPYFIVYLVLRKKLAFARVGDIFIELTDPLEEIFLHRVQSSALRVLHLDSFRDSEVSAAATDPRHV